MKILVLYESKYGCTEDCAKYLANKLNHESKVINIKDFRMNDLQKYDFIVIGGSIYFGKIQKSIKLFCEQNMKLLLTKNIILFLCCTTPEQVNDFFKNNFPAQLLDHSMETINFGGELRQDKLGFFERKITAMVSKLEPKETGIMYKNIDLLAASINETFKR